MFYCVVTRKWKHIVQSYSTLEIFLLARESDIINTTYKEKIFLWSMKIKKNKQNKNIYKNILIIKDDSIRSAHLHMNIYMAHTHLNLYIYSNIHVIWKEKLCIHTSEFISQFSFFFVIVFWFGKRPSRKLLNYITTFIFDLNKYTHFEAFSQVTTKQNIAPWYINRDFKTSIIFRIKQIFITTIDVHFLT